MKVKGYECQKGNEIIDSKLREFLMTSIDDQYTTHQICKSIQLSRTNLYTALTAKKYFDSVKKSYKTYLETSQRNVKCEISKFMYERKIKEVNRIICNDYLLFIACTIIASKTYMDLAYTNASWIEICFFSAEELNLAERHILEILNYDVCLDWNELKTLYDEYGEILTSNTILDANITHGTNIIKKTLRTIFKFIICSEV